jgi:hypothetical protein
MALHAMLVGNLNDASGGTRFRFCSGDLDEIKSSPELFPWSCPANDGSNHIGRCHNRTSNGGTGAQTKSQLPIRSGKYSTLTSVLHFGRMITYSHIIDFDKEFIRQANLQDEAPKRQAYNLCNQKDTAVLLKHGGIFHYINYDNGGLYVFEMEITKSDC